MSRNGGTALNSNILVFYFYLYIYFFLSFILILKYLIILFKEDGKQLIRITTIRAITVLLHVRYKLRRDKKKKEDKGRK